MEKVHATAERLQDFLAAALADDWELAASIQADIARLEGEADKLKRSIRLHLPKGLFMPVSRSDLLSLVTTQDKVANNARDVAGIMLGRRMQIPAPLHDIFGDYLRVAIAASAQALEAIEELDELLETGFRGREVDTVHALIEQLEALEQESDEIQVKVRAQLLQLEPELPPVNVMFLYKVIDEIGSLADHAERVGSRLELLLAR